jgi:hypothetical protein
MTDTFRALCAEVLAFNNGESPYNFSGLTPYDRDIAAFDAWQDIRQRLKSALRRAQPEPEEPTDEELNDLCADHGFVFDDNHGEGLSILSDIVKAVLARWGRPAIEPVPVSERLPGEGDCDPSFQCWWFTPSEEKWILWPIKWAGPECSHWLPHWALPVPNLNSTTQGE